jgi:hypothetical protein
MTEAEAWDTATTDGTPMIYWLMGAVPERKFWLLAAASATRIQTFLPDKRHLNFIHTIELFADGEATMLDYDSAYRLAEVGYSEYWEQTAGDARELTSIELDMAGWFRWLSHCRILESIVDVTGHPSRVFERWHRPDDAQRERVARCDLIRDLIGNPHLPLPVTADPSWLTSTVVSLAHGIYQDRAFDRLPILADALQDAGCDNEDVLNHCRSEGPHVRGCWVVDLVLGKV